MSKGVRFIFDNGKLFTLGLTPPEQTVIESNSGTLWEQCLLLRCFDTFFKRPYRYFSIALKVILSLSDHYKIFTSD